jgi:opacity protein-like surface antigen
MKVSRFSVLVALLGAVQAQAAQPGDSAYALVHLGGNAVKDWDASVDFGAGAALPGKVAASRGLHGGFALGRQSGHLRYEAEFQGGRFDIEGLSLGAVSRSVDARGSYQALTVNAYRVDQLSEKLDSMIGAGIGWGRVKLPLLSLSSGCDCFGPADKNGFAWQVRAGLVYRLSPRADLLLQASRLVLPAPERSGTPGVRYDRQAFPVLSIAYAQRF